ncbi:hypothetical protein Tco_1090303 [Tanacetum coccineum]|uniref:Uncharacterized protein n=1 Tax=Tanacetum coccineum TaxID=301880 RepID=A0ABQ5I552_9ASTR
MGLGNKKTIHAQPEAETMTHPNYALHHIDVENYAEAMTHPKPALHPIDVENYDASHSDDEDEAEKDVAASYRIE